MFLAHLYSPLVLGRCLLTEKSTFSLELVSDNIGDHGGDRGFDCLDATVSNTISYIIRIDFLREKVF